VQVSKEGTPHFIHRTFGEYYVADFLVNQLTKEQVQEFLLQKIFLEEDYQVIRAFIDGFISRSELLERVLKQCGKRIPELGKHAERILLRAGRESKANIIGFLIDCMQVAGHTDILVELLLAQEEGRLTTWHLVELRGHIKVLEKLRKCDKEKLAKEKFSYKLLLAKDFMGRTVWHNAAASGHTEVLETLWEWAKEELTPDELKEIFFLGKDNKEKTAWHLAARMGNINELLKLWEWAKEELTTEELHNRIVIATDSKGERNCE
jgi:hypothetical protein